MSKKILLSTIVFIILIIFTFSLYPHIRYFFLSTGIFEEEVLIAGTGSMYPTFPKIEGKSDILAAKEIVAWPKMQRYPGGVKVFSNNYFTYKLKHGDIVEFENEKTGKISQEKYGEEAGFVKRIIALPGDTITLRDGYVLLNGKTLDEPYTAKPRSTYGGEILSDCQILKVPPDSVFVLGDNRKASLDSRFELGLVKYADIDYVLPWEKQKEYKKLWRDTSQDSSFAHKATLDSQKFLTLLNNKRKDNSLPFYKYNSLLVNSAKIRGSAMIKSDDFSTEATRSGVNLEKAVKQAGYDNIIFAEVFTRGFYEGEELLDNFLEFPETKKILFSREYQDIGIASVLGEINNCPVQVVVAHLGGYVPPNYTTKEIESWQSLIDNLEKAIPSWQTLQNSEGIDKEKLNQLNDLLATRLNNAKKILIKMKANQWLNEEEERLANDDKRLGEEAEKIIAELVKH